MNKNFIFLIVFFSTFFVRAEKPNLALYDTFNGFAFDDSVTCINVGGYYGAMDMSGEMIVQPIYKYPLVFINGMAVVVDPISNRMGAVNTNGDFVIHLLYDQVGIFKDLPYLNAIRGKKNFVYNAKGNQIIEDNSSVYFEIKDNKYFVSYKFDLTNAFYEKDKISAIYNLDGSEIFSLESKYIKISYFENQIACAQKDKQTVVLNLKNNKKYICYDFSQIDVGVFKMKMDEGGEHVVYYDEKFLPISNEYISKRYNDILLSDKTLIRT